MDIRNYFGVKQSTTPRSSTIVSKTTRKQVTSKKKPIIESDSDDNTLTEDKPRKKTPVKTKSKRCIIDSSDESANESSTKKLKTSKDTTNKRSRRLQLSDSSTEESSPVTKKRLGRQSTFQNVKVTSKFFKQTSAAAMFGDEPIKRSDSKLKEIQAKLKMKSKEAPQDIPQIPDDDADFEATLAQLDEIGVNGWITSANEKELREIKFIETERFEPESTSKSRGRKKLKDDVDLVKSVTSKNLNKKPCFKAEDASSSSNTDSGFDSQMSSDSQNLDGTELKVAESKKLETLNESVRHVSPRKLANSTSSSAKSTSPAKSTLLSVAFKRVEESFSEPKVLLPKLAARKPTSNEKENRKRITNESSIGKDTEKKIVESSGEYELWVEKYKPTSTKKIIGQQGDKSNVKKLTDWLNNWYKNNVGKKKATFVPNGWNKDPTGACFKAALLSGPPGVGKTTSVNLVCKELGFDTVEFNASDTRSKKLLQNEVSRLLSNTSLIPFFSKEEPKEAVTKKHVLVMDEVDGMAGNEDRGGVQELIQLIKTTKVPIICMCNDRNHPKIRSLVNYCFDLRFSRPRVEQIKGYMRSVCFKEKLNISNEALTDVITSANNDVRLVLNHLSMLVADKSNLEASKKHIKLGAWDVLRKVFSKDEHKNMNTHDKCDLFFFDYNIAPLFVQENYLTVKPLSVSVNDKCKKMELFAQAADCISRGDLVDKNIRTNMAWSLLPTQAVFASYAPGEILEGYCGGQINFPSWLGKNSRQNKMDRLLQEIQIHTRLKLSASKESINLDYASHLRDLIVGPLVREGADGVKSALEMLHEYQLLKEDLDSLQELCQWPNSRNQLASLDSKVKAAFTRSYNKNPPVRPYSLIAPVKKTASNVIEDLGMEDDEENEEERSDNETDAMIIVKKKLPSAKKTETSAPSSSKKATSSNKNAGKGGRKK